MQAAQSAIRHPETAMNPPVADAVKIGRRVLKLPLLRNVSETAEAIAAVFAARNIDSGDETYENYLMFVKFTERMRERPHGPRLRFP